MIGLAGTVTALAASSWASSATTPCATHHSALTPRQVEQLFARLSAADLEERRSMLAEPEARRRHRRRRRGAGHRHARPRHPELLVSESDILDGLAASLR